MFFLPMFKKINISSTNSIMKYFITQSISRNILLLSLIFIYYNLYNNIFNLTIFISLWLKLGIFPFQTWFFSITENLNWNSFFLVISVQKIIPIWILYVIHNYSIFYINILLICNLIYSIIEIINQTSIRWIISLSSLRHSRWILLRINYLNNSWQIYLLTYLIINILLYNFIKKNNWNSLNSIINNKNNLKDNLYFLILILNFIGFPPTLGFLIKILVLISINSPIIAFLLIFNSFIRCYIYLSFFIKRLSHVFIKYKNKKNYYNYLINIINICSFFIITYIVI